MIIVRLNKSTGAPVKPAAYTAAVEPGFSLFSEWNIIASYYRQLYADTKIKIITSVVITV